jgi:hypothetical protein
MLNWWYIWLPLVYKWLKYNGMLRCVLSFHALWQLHVASPLTLNTSAFHPHSVISCVRSVPNIKQRLFRTNRVKHLAFIIKTYLFFSVKCEIVTSMLLRQVQLTVYHFTLLNSQQFNYFPSVFTRRTNGNCLGTHQA